MKARSSAKSMPLSFQTKSFALLATVIVAVACSGCVMWPGKTTYDTPEKPTELKEGKTDRAAILKALGNPREQTADGKVALHEYTRTRRLHVVAPTLAFEGQDVHGVDEFNATFLLLVVYDPKDIVARLETYKCTKGDSLCNSKHRLCGMLFDTDNAQLLRQYCKADVIDYQRRLALAQPLHEAARRGDLGSAKEPISQGATLDVADKHGRTPLLVAAREGHTAVAKLLVEQGANLNVQDRKGYMPLHYAARGGHADLVKALLAREANVDATLRNGRTPLYLAVYNGHVDAAKLLIAGGANVNTTFSGRTPLHDAARWGEIDMVRLLLESGADVNARDQRDRTPLWIAIKRRHRAIIQLLERYEAKE